MPLLLNRKQLSRGGYDFIDEAYLHGLLERRAEPGEIRDIIAKSMAKQPLSVAETAALLSVEEPSLVEEIFGAARQLKRDVYGNRIVLFAPVYVGNECTNDCAYCAFRRSNVHEVRRTLSAEQLREQIVALENKGHKRLILVFGEHPRYDAPYMAECIRQVYATKTGHGEIRRANLNAAPLDHESYAIVKEAGIGTYQIFQETYHHETYRRVHPTNTFKGDFLWRLDGVARAMEAGCDDVGIGALFGLYDWRFEVLGLVSHALHLQKHFNVGPHTISFPRLRPACGTTLDETYFVTDEQFKRLVAILRLSVPYTGLICTAREPPAVRREIMSFGISQIDAGSRVEIGGYTETSDSQVMELEQFELGDIRPLDTVVRELLVDGYIPSFCTACYRSGRTGEQFMEFAIPGFIQNLCTPNALSTLMEYLIDYASPETRAAGENAILAEVEKFPEGERKRQLQNRLQRIVHNDERDLYF
ncbi:MAG: [FeFe] hydrogenase H-cluster radical SAM maturase HydG [Planctomycetaceae bacterium]|nr:[FeFe] hydrogenase H-cluster radical SAM maturase HydG [Planctomycetaceae bacterium]